jgi:hypothetical protein
MKLNFLFCGTKFPKSGLDRSIVEVSRSHTIRHTHTHTHTHTQLVGLPCASDQPVAETATYTTHNKYKRQISMCSEEFERAVTGSERLQTCALERAAAETD